MLRYEEITCFTCHKPFRKLDNYSVGDELHFNEDAMAMGGFSCPECGEKYDYEIRNEKLTLRKCVVSPGDYYIAEFITIENKLSEGMLNLSRQSNCLDFITKDLDLGADVNVTDERDGSSALMCASYNGFSEYVKLFLDRGAEVNHVNYDGETALMFASKYDQTEIVKLLLESDVDVNAKAKNGDTALSYAKKKEIIQILKEAGAKDTAE